jgi:hypothetical protein
MKTATKGTGYNKHTVLTVIGIFLIVAGLHEVLFSTLREFEYNSNHVSYWWCLAWLEAFVFSTINTSEANEDFKATQVRARIRSDAPAAWWFLRMDIMATLVSFFMAAAGYISVLRLGQEKVVLALMLAGVVFSITQAWNRADRLRLRRIVREDREARHAKK